MRRLLHWQFVVPRVLLAIVVLLAAQYVLGIVARSVAIRSGEAAMGAGVEVGHARVSVADRQVVFNDLRVVNPQRPSEIVFEADRFELNFATSPLLHKRAVVESGRLSGLRFGQIGDSSVADLPCQSNADAKPLAWFKDDADAAACKWLEKLGGQFSLELVQQFASVRRTEAFCANWSMESANLESRLAELENRAAEMQRAVDAAHANPLRNDKLVDDLPTRIVDLKKEFTALSDDVAKLPNQLETERRAIIAARRHDDDGLSERLRLEPVEANSLSAYLLREHAARQLNQLVGWLRWMREAAPAKSQAGSAKPRGEDVLFAGCRRGPGILIRSLQLDGVARFGGQPLELRGSLANWTSAPRLQGEPVRLHVFGKGSMPLELQATMDRTGATARDELLVDCRGVLLPAASLGRADQLEVEMAPSVGSISMSVVVDGDKLTGNIQIVQQKVEIKPALHGPGGAMLAAAMSDTLVGVNSVATRLSLGGTLNEPTCSLWSNLGVAVAESLQRGLRRAGDQHAKMLLVESGRRVDEKLAQVDRQIAEQQARFAHKTTDITARLQRIAAVESPRYRISAEKDGRSLPNNSLFR